MAVVDDARSNAAFVPFLVPNPVRRGHVASSAGFYRERVAEESQRHHPAQDEGAIARVGEVRAHHTLEGAAEEEEEDERLQEREDEVEGLPPQLDEPAAQLAAGLLHEAAQRRVLGGAPERPWASW